MLPVHQSAMCLTSGGVCKSMLFPMVRAGAIYEGNTFWHINSPSHPAKHVAKIALQEGANAIAGCTGRE